MPVLSRVELARLQRRAPGAALPSFRVQYHPLASRLPNCYEARTVLCPAVSIYAHTTQRAQAPSSVVSNAIHVMRVATGEIDDSLTEDGKKGRPVALG